LKKPFDKKWSFTDKKTGWELGKAGQPAIDCSCQRKGKRGWIIARADLVFLLQPVVDR
jgi:hypothetical protein